MIAAAAIAMAACTNDNILTGIEDVEEQQTVIGFSSHSDMMLRGDATNKANLEFYHTTFAVYGTKTDAEDNVQYIFGGKAETAAGAKDGVTCTYTPTVADQNATGEWKYTSPRIWDKKSAYDFVAYAPVAAANTLRFNYTTAGGEIKNNGTFKTSSAYTLVGGNAQATATTAEKRKGFTGDLDLMTSAVEEVAGSTGGTVNLVFKHILAKLNVTVAKSANIDGTTVKITSVAITGLDDTGSYDESNYAAAATSGWSSITSTDADYKLSYTNASGLALNDSDDDPYYVIESLIMPQTVANTAKLVLKYQIEYGEGDTETFVYPLDIKDAFTSFMDRCNYNLKFTIGTDVIKFDATVTDWADQNKSIDL